MTLATDPAGTGPAGRPGRREPPLQRVSAALVAGLPVVVARRLLGTLLVRDDGHGRRVGRIVETEAYGGPGDLASHARAGRTSRTAVMFGPPGRAYVYLIYGMHHCLNVVCDADGEAGAVLIRAVEPVAGVAAMRAARARPTDPASRLAAGPARICQALAVDRRFDGSDLLDDDTLWLASDGSDPLPYPSTVAGPRIGVGYAGGEWATRPWRFGVAGSPSLSRPFPPGR